MDQFKVLIAGGSMQITFAPSEMETIDQSPSDFITTTSLFGAEIKLYCHSYLGLGLMSARESVLETSDKDNSVIVTPCMPANYEIKWKNGQKK